MPNDQRYISNELAHFVGRGKAPDDQYSLLVNILRSGSLTHPPHIPGESGNLKVNLSEKLSTNSMYNPGVVCFCDIPVDDLQIHTSKYSRFGFSLSKEFVARQGGAPVFYLPLYTYVQGWRHFSGDQPNVRLSKGEEGQINETIPLARLTIEWSRNTIR